MTKLLKLLRVSMASPQIVCVFLLISGIIQSTTGIQFPCHHDICDTDDHQICNDNEKRCEYCTRPKCQDGFVEKGCEKFCMDILGTSTSTKLPNKTPESEGNENWIIPTAIIVSLIVMSGIVVAVVYYILWRRKKSCQSGGICSSAISSGESLVEEEKKRPLMESGHDAMRDQCVPNNNNGHQTCQVWNISPSNDLNLDSFSLDETYVKTLRSVT